jgi:Arc/MetJ-type ribon-helix-helix transcriptional regulator
MEIQLPPDIEAKIRSLMATGRFASEDDLLRQAMAALKRHEEYKTALVSDSNDTNNE